MAVQTRAIKRRIKSVRNTRKITRAMELIAASKMRKATVAVLGPRPYLKLAWETVQGLAPRVNMSAHPLLARRAEVKRVLLVLFTSDRGLAGGYNANAVRAAVQAAAAFGPGVKIDAMCIGKRGAEAFHRLGFSVIAEYTELADNPSFEEILPIARLAITEFLNGTYDKVDLVYTDFVSAISQKPIVRELLPLAMPNEEVPSVGEEPLFEPTAAAVLERLLPRVLEASVYQAVLEAAASEHAARMLAMHSATDAAGDMIDSLSLAFNQARQAGITQEIAEISGGKAALETSSE